MPDRCCVTACTSNYDSSGKYASVFLFPKEEELKNIWLRKIPRKNFTPSKRSVVCEKHFADDEIVRFDELLYNGENIKIKRSRPKLKTGAFPTIFPGCPSYLSENQTVKRVSRDEKFELQDQTNLDNFLESDKVKSFHDFQKSFTTKLPSLLANITVFHCDVHTCILFMCFTSRPQILKSIKVKTDMSVSVFIGDNELKQELFGHLLEYDKITLWSQIENLINMVNVKSSKDIFNHYDAAFHHWELYTKEEESSEEYAGKKFISGQMLLHSKSKASRRYTSDMYQFASCLYVISPACYRALLNSKVLILPCVESLKKVLNVLSLHSSTVSTENISYIKAKCDKLKEEEKLVNLLIDEIHIKKKISYKGKHITGFAENQENCEASSIQAFMISSCFSKFKEVVALVPVHCMTANDLFHLTKQTLSILNKSGFEVFSIISDNNSVNRNMFNLMANGSLTTEAVKNPVSGSNLYLLFDAVHILKCIRNNWINQLDSEKTFICPDFSGKKDKIQPRFGLLRKVFHIEKESHIKYAFHLNAKALYPTKMERQNVLPAVNIFHESNPAALDRLSEQNPTIIHTVEDTCTFLRLIKKWWDIMNVSHQNKGKFTRNPDSLPLSTSNNESFIFMTAFVEWAKKWKSFNLKGRNGCLSNETFFALIHTSSTILNAAKSLLADGAKYVLTAKFHTDALEFRFSQYRQMSGCNYHVSLQQVLESERKLRIKSVLYLHSNRYGNIPMRLFINDLCLSEVPDVDLSPFSDVVEELDINISSHDAEVITYIAGYCTYKLKLACNGCKYFFYGAVNLSVDLNPDLLLSPLEKIPHTGYLNMINRGGMKIPSSNVVFTLSACYVIFEKLISNQYENMFMAYNIKQHTLLVKLTQLYLYDSFIFNLKDVCPECNICFSVGILRIIQTFSNVCLNNYSKSKTDDSVLNKNKAKQKVNNSEQMLKNDKEKSDKCTAEKIEHKGLKFTKKAEEKNMKCKVRKVKKFEK